MTEKIKIDGVKAVGCMFYEENVELKTVHKQLKQMIKSKESLLEKAIKENTELKQKLNEWEKELQSNERIINRLIKENEKLNQALEEIREMAIYDCQRECSNNSENCTIGSCLEQRIQRKINEVLNGN